MGPFFANFATKNNNKMGRRDAEWVGERETDVSVAKQLDAQFIRWKSEGRGVSTQHDSFWDNFIRNCVTNESQRLAK